MLILTLNYALNKKSAHKALCEWYYLKNRVKTIIYCAVLGVLAVNFLLSAIFLSDSMSVTLFAVSVFGICMLFSVPPFQLKSYANAYGEGEDYTLNIFEEKAEVVSSKTQAEIEFSEISAVYDTKNFICIETRGKLFPIAKTAQNEENAVKIAAFLSEKLPKRYKK